MTRFGESYFWITGADSRPRPMSGSTGTPGGSVAGSLQRHHGATTIQSRSAAWLTRWESAVIHGP